MKKKVSIFKKLKGKFVVMMSLALLMVSTTSSMVFAQEPTAPINFDEYSGIFDFIVEGVTKVASIFTVFPINIMLACGLLGIAVALIKKFAPSKRM